ncbi:diguanylate cyclase [Thermosipho sp. 1074]|nr:diguanylate cyclase [Thermosipho sp. 1074]
MVIKKNLYLVIFSLFIGIFLLVLTDKFVFSTSWFFVVSFALSVFISRFLDLNVSKYKFSLELLIALPYLLFITPETVTVILPIIWFLTSKRNRLLRALLSFLMCSAGTYLYYLAGEEFLRIPLFILGALLANFIWMSIYSLELIKELINPLLNSYLLIFFGSFIISVVYLFSEVKIFPFLFLAFVYVVYLFVVVFYIKSYNIMLVEKIERKKLEQENENLMDLIELIYDENVENFEERLDNILEIICKISSYEAALLSLFDRKDKKILRIAKAGITDDVFFKLRSSVISIDSTMKYFSKRFEREGCYFVPEDAVSLEEEVSYVFENYMSFEYENSWKPKDLLLVPILDDQSNMIGYISFDKPVTGMRPSVNDLKLLKTLSWFVYQFLKRTPYARYWISKDLKYLSYPEFVRFCESVISNSEEVVLGVLDVDNFDSINFEKGPEYAEMISEYIEDYFNERKDVYFYRLSGENFVFLFPNSTKLKSLMYFGKFNEKLLEKFNVTVSIGLAHDEGENSYFDLLSKAREALKVAKKSGGGRIMAL